MMNNTKKSKQKEEDEMAIEFQFKGGRIAFHYKDLEEFKHDLKTRVLPFIDDPSQKKLDKWIKRTEAESKLNGHLLPN